MTSLTPIPNPFLPARWEHHEDKTHLIWFSPTAERISQEKPTYVAGTRGAGKTTLLRSICWEDIVGNPSLKAQKRLSDLKYLGIYIKFPDHIGTSIRTDDLLGVFPNAPDEEHEAYVFFSLIVEAICVEKTLTALSELRISNELIVEPSSELELCKKLISDFSNLANFFQVIPRTFLDLASMCRSLIRRMNEASRRGAALEILPLLPVREPGELLKMVVMHLSNSCKLKKGENFEHPGFKFCLDDCEVLNNVQRKTVNSLVRNSQWPISWVICSVGDSVATAETFQKNQRITKHDRNFEFLDDRDKDEFESLCEVVANMRLQIARSHGKVDVERLFAPKFHKFSLQQKFGKTTVDEIFKQVVTGSTNPIGNVIKTAAEDLLENKNKFRRSKKLKDLIVPPYTEAYLLLLWNHETEDFDLDFPEYSKTSFLRKAGRRQTRAQSASFRRKSVAALLHASNLLNRRSIPYSGASIILSLADGSVRDFLEIIGAIYDEYVGTLHRKKTVITPEKVLNEFYKYRRPINRGVQSAGIASASKEFKNAVGTRFPTAEPATMIKLIEFLGSYTEFLQSNSKTVAPLRFCEQGIFVFKSKNVDYRSQADIEDLDDLYELLWQAELSGYLRRPERETNEALDAEAFLSPVAYRLHRRFAPDLNFSYRGAYEKITVSAEFLSSFLAKKTQFSTFEEWIAFEESRSGNADQLQLGFEL